MTTYRGRRAVSVENDVLRVTVLEEGGHIAEIADRASGVNPLWTPHWPSIEPSQFNPARDLAYGGGADASLLAGLMGHNLCLDIFGGPSAEEAAAGLPVHGETSVARFEISSWNAGRSAPSLSMAAVLPAAQLRVERRLTLEDRVVRITERVENLAAADRPVGWTQHVTMGPPFVARGQTALRLTADRSHVYPGTFGPADYLRPGAEFTWPRAPRDGDGAVDLRLRTTAASSSAYTAHRMDRQRDRAFFIAHSPASGLAFGYEWERQDFPWAGLWEENHARTNAPWDGRTETWAVEFGVSPFPETRREMIERGRLFDTPCFRWLPAGSTTEVEYRAFLAPAAAIPEDVQAITSARRRP